MSYKPLFLFDEGDQGIPVKEKPSKRKVPQTSRDANNSVKDMKEKHCAMIVDALNKMRIGGTYIEIAAMVRLDKAQVNRRLSDLVTAGIVFNVGITRPTPSGRKSMVRQLVTLK